MYRLFFILVLFVTVMFFTPAYGTQHCPLDPSDEVEAKLLDSPKMVLSTSKVVINKIIGVFPYSETSTSFHVINIGNETAIGLSSYIGELSIIDQSKPSISNEFLPTDIFSTTVDCNVVEPEQFTTVTISPNSLPTDIGNYKGTILVYGKNFEPLTLDLEFKIKQNPFELVGFTLLGIGVAIIFGLHEAKKSYYKGEKDKISKRYSVLGHINNHIKFFNKIKTEIDKNEWEKIIKGNEYFLREYDTKKDDSDFDAMMKWYEGTEKDMTKMYIPKSMMTTTQAAGVTKNLDLKTFDNPEPKTLYPAIIKHDVNTRNIVFGVFSVVAGVPLAVFSSYTFLENPAWDVLIAIGIGFAIYRSKDIPKLFKEYFKSS